MKRFVGILIGALLGVALIGTGFAVWTINYGSVNASEIIDPTVSGVLVITNPGLKIDTVDDKLVFTPTEEGLDTSVTFNVKPGDPNWWGPLDLLSVEQPVNLKIETTVVDELPNCPERAHWSNIITMPDELIVRYDEWLDTSEFVNEDVEDSFYVVTLSFAYKDGKTPEQRMKDLVASGDLVTSTDQIHYLKELEASLSALKFQVEFSLNGLIE